MILLQMCVQTASRCRINDFAGVRTDIIPVLDYPLASNNHPPAVSVRLGNVIRVRSREGLRRVSLQSSASDMMSQTLRSLKNNIICACRQAAISAPANWRNCWPEKVHPHGSLPIKSSTITAGKSLPIPCNRPYTTITTASMISCSAVNRVFCEHYAQSFVVMMRAAGIPARVVTGYLGGDYQENGNFWQIRSKDCPCLGRNLA